MASIREIAKLAGVSAATVSRVLNQDETMSVSEATRKRIINVANQLNYHKVSSSGGKSPKKSGLLSLALLKTHGAKREEEDPYFRQIQEGLELEASNWNFRLESLKLGQVTLEQLASFGAVVVVGVLTDTALADIYAVNPNLIIVDHYFANSRYDLVHTDFAKQTEQVLNYLYAQNHRQIAFIGAETAVFDLAGRQVKQLVDVRTIAYDHWMTIHGLADNRKMMTGDWTMSSGLKAAQEILHHSDVLPTAIISASDPMSVGIYRALHLEGLTIPETISIFSFDDVEMAAFLSPPLSTVHIDGLEIGRVAIRLAKERLIDGRRTAIRVEVASELVMRESVTKRESGFGKGDH